MANQLKFYLFNSDNTYNLEVVEKFLLDLEEKYGFRFSIDRLAFGLQRMGEVCEKILPSLVMDVAVFVVHANESRLSINEDNAGIGYARIYRALLQKTDSKVLIVIGGDNNYRDEDEQGRSVISRWAKRKVASQFGEEYLDGRQSFIFSWNEKHRPIHEEAMRHYLDPGKRGSKFEYTPPKLLQKAIEPEVPQPSPKPIPPVNPRPASADTNLSREVLPEVVALGSSGEIFQSSLLRSDKEILIQKDGEEDTGIRRRSFSDRDQSKSELRHDLDKGTYGAIGTGETPPATYQGDVILLETIVRHGKISYEDGDVVQREAGWQPTVRQETAVENDLKSYPVHMVTFYRTGNGSVSYKYDNVDRGCFKACCCMIWRFMAACWGCMVAYWGIVIHWLRGR
ncbi:uncharacterized protein [Porites lutea]|uniref:uncharacterized protein n=1 Tax=Porites lutea TaxID=51062 RepID=UPI003CC525AA